MFVPAGVSSSMTVFGIGHIAYCWLHQEYVEKDARENKARIDAENKLLKDKLDKEAAELKKKLQVKR